MIDVPETEQQHQPVAGLCVITLDKAATTALFDLLGDWLG
jgi:hypothetical protein